MLISAVFSFFFSLLASFYWHISPPSSAFLLKLQLSRHEGPCGPDQMFQAAHFPTLCLMEYSWATRHHGTQQSNTQTRRDGLFIYLFHHPDAWLSNAQQQFIVESRLFALPNPFYFILFFGVSFQPWCFLRMCKHAFLQRTHVCVCVSLAKCLIIHHTAMK